MFEKLSLELVLASLSLVHESSSPSMIMVEFHEPVEHSEPPMSFPNGILDAGTKAAPAFLMLDVSCINWVPIALHHESTRLLCCRALNQPIQAPSRV
jgi:hypothetical protein